MLYKKHSNKLLMLEPRRNRRRLKVDSEKPEKKGDRKMKRKFGLAFALVTLLLLFVVRLGYADSSILVRDGIYITVPSSVYLSETASSPAKMRTYASRDGYMDFTIVELSANRDNSALKSDAMQNNYSNYQFGQINNVYQLTIPDLKIWADRIFFDIVCISC